MIDAYKRVSYEKVPFLWNDKAYLIDKDSAIYFNHMGEIVELQKEAAEKNMNQFDSILKLTELYYRFLEAAISKEFVKDLKKAKLPYVDLEFIYNYVLNIQTGASTDRAEKDACYSVHGEEKFIEWYGEDEYNSYIEKLRRKN